MKLTCMTYNLRNFNANDGENCWQNRIGRVTELIRANNPDIFGVQEAFYEMIMDLMPSLEGYEWVGKGRVGEREGEICAVFYRADRFEAKENGQFWLSETPDVVGSKSWDSSLPRICTSIRLQERESGKSLFVYNTHLDHKGSEARLNGIKLIHEKMSQPVLEGFPAIFMGDLNCHPDSEPIRYLLENGFGDHANSPRLYDVYEKTGQAAVGTFNAFGKANGVNPIDYVFVTPDIQVHNVKVDKQFYGSGFPSDHYPVIAEITLR